jgi:hypothetical protein
LLRLAVLLSGIAVVLAAFLLATPWLKAAARAIPDRNASSGRIVTLVAGHEMPHSAFAFADSIGVNVHLNFTETNYFTHYEMFRALLIRLGVHHVRDGLIDAPQPEYYTRLSQLAGDGIHADLITAIAAPFSATLLTRPRPGTVEAYEAPNEYDTSDNRDWASDLGTFQAQLYAAVHKNAAGPPVPVFGPSLTTEAAYDAAGNLSASLDAGNVHPYPAGHEPATPGRTAFGGHGEGSLHWNIGVARAVSGAKPMVVTETGYGDAPAVAEGVPPAVKARYISRLVFETWNLGVARTYLYQFLDAGTDGFETYGLIDDHMQPKPAYTALASVLKILHDGAPPTKLTTLAYTLRGPERLHHSLLQRRDGSYALALWLAVPSWDTGSHQPIATPPQPAILTFAAPRKMTVMTLSDDGIAHTQAPLVREALTFPVTGNVTIIEVR